MENDLLYRPTEAELRADFVFNKNDRLEYVQKMCNKYRFKPRFKEDLDILNHTATTRMGGWSQEQASPP